MGNRKIIAGGELCVFLLALKPTKKMENQQPPTGEAKNSQKKEWYRGWGMIIAILIWPIFLLWYMWAKTNWSRNTKIAITAVSLILAIMANGNSKSNVNTAPQKVSVKSQSVADKKEEQVSDIQSQTSEASSQNQNNPVAVAEEPKDPVAEDNAIAHKRFECKQEAYNKYLAKRNEECHKLKREDECLMPPINYLPFEKEKHDEMDACYKTYVSTAKFNGEDEYLKEMGREKCLNYAEQYYIDKWDSQCKRMGRAKDCTLPTSLSTSLNDMLRGQRDECYMKYPVK